MLPRGHTLKSGELYAAGTFPRNGVLYERSIFSFFSSL
jgi:hypothetical protein